MSAPVWYIHTTDGPQGPYSAEQIREWISAGSITGEWHAWCEGMAAWQPIGSISDLAPPASKLAPAASPVTPSTPPAVENTASPARRWHQSWIVRSAFLVVILGAIGVGTYFAISHKANNLAVIMDIDGTIADESVRRAAAAGEDGELQDNEYDAYFEPSEVAKDKPLVAAREILTRLAEEGVTIYYVTGRPEETERATERWIRDNGFPDGPLRCRPRRARTTEFKIDAIEEAKQQFDVFAGVGQEDRDGPPYRGADIEGIFVEENDEEGWRNHVGPELDRLRAAAE